MVPVGFFSIGNMWILVWARFGRLSDHRVIIFPGNEDITDTLRRGFFSPPRTKNGTGLWACAHVFSEKMNDKFNYLWTFCRTDRTETSAARRGRQQDDTEPHQIEPVRRYFFVLDNMGPDSGRCGAPGTTGRAILGFTLVLRSTTPVRRMNKHGGRKTAQVSVNTVGLSN